MGSPHPVRGEAGKGQQKPTSGARSRRLRAPIAARIDIVNETEQDMTATPPRARKGLDLSLGSIALVGAAAIIAACATNASRWYITPAFTTFLILWCVLYSNPNEREHLVPLMGTSARHAARCWHRIFLRSAGSDAVATSRRCSHGYSIGARMTGWLPASRNDYRVRRTSVGGGDHRRHSSGRGTSMTTATKCRCRRND